MFRILLAILAACSLHMAQALDFQELYEKQLQHPDYESLFDDGLLVLEDALRKLGHPSDEPGNVVLEEKIAIRWEQILTSLLEESSELQFIVREHVDTVRACLKAGLIPLPTFSEHTKDGKHHLFSYTTLGNYLPRGFVPVSVSLPEHKWTDNPAHPLRFNLLRSRFQVAIHDLAHADLMACVAQSEGMFVSDESRFRWQRNLHGLMSRPRYERIALFYLLHEDRPHWIRGKILSQLRFQNMERINRLALFDFVLELAIVETRRDPFKVILGPEAKQKKRVCAWVNGLKTLNSGCKSERGIPPVPQSVQDIFSGDSFIGLSGCFAGTVQKLQVMCHEVDSSDTLPATDAEIYNLYENAFNDDFWCAVIQLHENLAAGIRNVRLRFGESYPIEQQSLQDFLLSSLTRLRETFFVLMALKII